MLDSIANERVASTGADLPWRWEEDGLTVTRSVGWSAPGCHGGCGIKIYTDKNGDLVKVEGDEDSPNTQGRLCVRCLDIKEAVYSPSRITHPMKRAKEDRGKDKWIEISWDEAYDIICNELNRVKEEYGAEAVLFCSGTGRDYTASFYRLGLSFGSPNTVFYPQAGEACYVPRMAASNIMMGTFCIPDVSAQFSSRYDTSTGWTAPKNIFIWGNNPIVANADGNFGHWIIDCMKLGSKLIVVDPRLTWLASQAELWLQLRNGTDAALAMTMINYLIENNLYDKEFVDEWCYGFEDLKEVVSEWTLEHGSEITWVPAEKIARAAKFMAEKPTAIQWGLALDQTKECIPGSMAVVNLWCLTGNIDIPGAMVSVANPFGAPVWIPPQPAEFMPPEQAAKVIGSDKYPLVTNAGPAITQTETTYRAMLTDDPYPVRATFIETTNPLSCCSQSAEALALPAFQRMEFNAVVDYTMTATAMAVADVFLPTAMFVEDNSMRCIWHYIQCINKCVDVAGYDVKGDHTINFELGKRLAPDIWVWDSLEEYFTWLVAECGMSFESVRESNWVYEKFSYEKYKKGLQRPDGQPGFNTPTGRIELNSTILGAWGFDPMPKFYEPDRSPYATPELMEEYPLILTTGARNWASFHSEHRQFPRLRALKPNPEFEIHPETAKRYGIKDGDWAYIENEFGRAKMQAKVTIVVPEWLISADHGWWFPERNREDLFDTFESNANQLIPSECGKTGMGANCKSLICKVYPANE